MVMDIPRRRGVNKIVITISHKEPKAMSKNEDKKKEAKKQPTKTMKEKRAEKKAKKEGKRF